ncbi:M1 family metallopeptidase [Paenibacillus sp. N1-5-1-14]|uniref:M1 family metallopeptidase n=1 Tax=Paenibacillus radicibacter TaxID=2972488 RepID=UPI002158E2C7|nr:M1 family metallopeptidase [Paenibacillus radicibacter]MCR8642576.1 M1 family metallopeptidase [Paenibacillus radicibacter]
MKNRMSNCWFGWILIILVASTTVYVASKLLLPINEPTLSRMEPRVDSLANMPTPTSAPKTEQALSNRIVEYHMNVELLPDTKELRGQQTITWKNPGMKSVDHLYMHLYPNAFASKKTTFMRESGGKLRNDKATEDSIGSMKLNMLQTQNGQDLTGRMWFVQPDDGNTDDHTLLKISLPQAVNPGESITLKTDFTVKMPFTFARMGYVDNFYMGGQWFPKLAVYETEGTRDRAEEGWNLHQYHGNSEFYADFGIFDVKIKVPSNFVVAGTGFPLKSSPEDPITKTKTYNFYSDDVHDFAWAASPRFRYYEETLATKNIPGLKIKLYLDPAHEALKSRYFAAAKKALTRYSEWYGSYPYDTLSIVIPPAGGNGAGGMEYPTLVTGWGAEDPSPGFELERVIVHEIGHQFFYGMVASNEFEEAWLDEGFTSYAEDALMQSEYGVSPNLPVEASYVTSPAALKQNAWDYQGHGHYADNVYIRGKLVLREIESRVGTDTMNSIMKTYFERWKFKHPTTHDFQNVVEEVTKQSWETFFNQFVYGSLMVDYSVDNIQTKKINQDGKTLYDNSVLIRKLGGTAAGVPIRFHFADGKMVERVWDGNDAQAQFKLQHTSPLDWVSIDPKFTMVLENKHINNYLQTSVDTKWKTRWNLGVTQLLETLFSWIAW